MKDESKTKKQLLAELNQLRQQVDKLESRLMEGRKKEDSKNTVKTFEYSKERYLRLAENIPGITYQYIQYPNDVIGEFPYISQGIRTLCELDPEDVYRDGNLMWSLIHREDMAEFKKSIELAASAIKQWDHEWRILTPSGKTKWVKGLATPERQPDGSMFWDGLLLDITDRKQAEEELMQKEHRFRTIFEHSPISIWEEDFSDVHAEMERLRGEGVEDLARYFEENPQEVTRFATLIHIIDINETSLHFFGGESKDDILSNLPAYFGGDALPVFREELLSLSRGETFFEAELSMLHPDRGKLMLQLNLQIVPGFEEDWSRVMASFVDITKRKKAEEELKKIEWLLEKENADSQKTAKNYIPDYGDVTKLNTERTILDNVGTETLKTCVLTSWICWIPQLRFMKKMVIMPLDSLIQPGARQWI
jgi:PAS domain S-box-containing protein